MFVCLFAVYCVKLDIVQMNCTKHEYLCYVKNEWRGIIRRKRKMKNKEEREFEERKELQRRGKWKRGKENQGLRQWKIIKIDLLFWSSDMRICRYVITRSEFEMRHRYGLDQLNTQIMTFCPPHTHTHMARTHNFQPATCLDYPPLMSLSFTVNLCQRRVKCYERQ